MKRTLLAIIPLSLIAADLPAKQSAKAVPFNETAIVRSISQRGSDLVAVRAKVRMSTLIELPKNEKILDIICGDKDMWVVNAIGENIASVKPAKAGSRTNLHLVGTSGTTYSFVLMEVSEDPQAQSDVKIMIEPKDEGSQLSTPATPSPANAKFVSVKELEVARRETALALEEAKKTKEEAQAKIDSGITAFVHNVRFPYRYVAGKSPFNIRAMYHDSKFTYIQARPEEAPALYEVKDNLPSMINWEYRNGLYVVRKVLDRGYFAIGKQKLSFVRQD